MHKYSAAAVLALVLAFVPLEATALESPDLLRATMGVLIESQLNPAFDSNVPAPSINFNLGAGLNFPFSPESRFSFAPTGDLYFYYGEFNSGQPVSADQAFSSTYILGALLNAPVMYTFPLGSGKFTLYAGLGLCLDLRFAFKSGDIPADSARNTDSADDAASDTNKYFWGKGRFLMPSTTVNIEYALNDRMGVGLSTRVLWPFYNIWTKEGYGFLDQTKYLINVAIRYKLKKKGDSQAAEPSAESAAKAGANPAEVPSPNAEAPAESAAAKPEQMNEPVPKPESPAPAPAQ
jgi:hypothetical protein